MDFKSDEKDMTGDTESNQEATLPGAGDSGAGDSGAGDPVAGDPVAGDPGICVPRVSQGSTVKE